MSVDEGFYQAFEQIKDLVYDYVFAFHKEQYLYVTGHSLGGAVATLFADYYQYVDDLVLFGSPRIGNKAFCKNVRDHVVRITSYCNNQDFVPNIPWFTNHVVPLTFINRRGEKVKKRPFGWWFRRRVKGIQDHLIENYYKMIQKGWK